MKKSGKIDQGKKNVNHPKTIPIPFTIGKIKENISISTNTPTKYSKEQIINQSINFHSQGNISEAAKLYQYCINQGFKDHRVFSNYGIILKNLGKLEKAELLYRKAIEIKPSFVDAHSNLGNLLRDIGNLKEAEISTRRAIELNPNFANTHLNLGNILKDLGNLKEAEHSYRKAVELNPNSGPAHYSLGVILKNFGRLEEAKISLSKAIKLNPCWEAYFYFASCLYEIKQFNSSLQSLYKAKKLVNEKLWENVIDVSIKTIDYRENKKIIKKFDKIILNRPVEDELINYLYSLKNKELNSVPDARYGKGYCSKDFELFHDSSPIISKLSTDLQNISKKALDIKEIVYSGSFFNIFVSGSGAKRHCHKTPIDKEFELSSIKYSLVYYLEIGDQSGENPGILNLYEPDEQILPTNGMIIIINAKKFHSVSYKGKKDRVMIGFNFYGL
tara:strand:+ start:665 stop:1999 length:1335 start_codon:yes stop_codon:yes gene_type:complete